MGGLLDTHIQHGTGSWDFRVGGAFNHVKDRWGISSNVLYSINTTGETADDDDRYGNWLNSDITARYQILYSAMNQTDLFLALGVNGEFRGREKLNDREIENTGGEVLYFSPGLQLEISALTIEASVQYPFYHCLNGEAQLDENLKSYLSINYGL